MELLATNGHERRGRRRRNFYGFTRRRGLREAVTELASFWCRRTVSVAALVAYLIVVLVPVPIVEGCAIAGADIGYCDTQIMTDPS